MEVLVARFRWIVLFALSLLLPFSIETVRNFWALAILLFVAIIYNGLIELNIKYDKIAVSSLARFSSLMDFLLASTAIYLALTAATNLWLIYVLLIITIAMRFGLIESLMTGVLSSFSYSLIVYLHGGHLIEFSESKALFIRFIFFMLIALFAGYLSKEERQHFISRDEMEQKRNRQRETIFRIGQALTSSLDLEDILQLIVESTNIILFSSGSSIYELDTSRGNLLLAATNGLPQRYLKKISLEFGDQWAGVAAQEKKPISCVNITNEDSPIKPIFIEYGVKSILAVPLLLEDEVVGVLETYSKKLHRFSEEEIELLNLFSSQAAVAIENAKLHQVEREIVNRAEKKARDLETLFRTAQTVTSSLKIDTVLNRVVDEVERVMNARVVSLMLYDETTAEVKVKIARGLNRQHISHAKFKPGETVEGAAFENKRPVMIDNLWQDTRFKLKEDVKKEKLRSMLSVPLQVKGKPIGVLNIYSEKKKGFSQNDLELLLTFAAQASVAIDNARLHEALINEERRHQEEEMLMAREIQQSLLPDRAPLVDGLDIGFLCIQAKQVGGDFYDFIPINGKVAFVIGDVSGKFLPAAMLISMNKYVLRSVTSKKGLITEPLVTLNKVLVEETDPEIFVTLIYGLFDPREKSFLYTNAGHMPLLHYHRIEDKVVYHKKHQLVLGVEPEVDFVVEKILLGKSDILVLFSDGVTDARSEDGEIFGMDRLNELIQQFRDLDAQSIAQKVQELVLSFSGNLSDDFTILVLKMTDSKRPNEIRVPNVESSVVDIRKFVREIATMMKFDETDVELLCLAADEAFSNSVRHAQNFSGRNEVRLKCHPSSSGLTIEISDGGRYNFSPSLAHWEAPDPYQEYGRGVFIIKSIMDEVEYDKREQGTTVRLTKYFEGGRRQKSEVRREEGR